MKPFPWKCEECGEHAVYTDTLDSYTTSMDHDGRPHQVTVSNFEVAKCRKCGAITLDGIALRRLSDALRAAAGLLQPTEIRFKRESLNLTQKDLAKYLQIAEATLSRWETGAQIQQRSMDKLLRLFFDLAEVRAYLGVRTSASAASSQSGTTSAGVYAFDVIDAKGFSTSPSAAILTPTASTELIDQKISPAPNQAPATPSPIQQVLGAAAATLEPTGVMAATAQQTAASGLAA
jgi:putative zinc finger/helix-turn-helix YgiT family protein